MKRVLFISTGLHTGGAEKQLVRMLSHLRNKFAKTAVISLASKGAVSNEIEALGVPVWHLELERSIRLPVAVSRLAYLVRTFRPDTILGWMYHGCLAAWWVRRLLAPRASLLWGIRQSLYEASKEKTVTGKVIKCCARLSGSVDSIIYNAHIARKHHESIGFAASKGMVIDNGFDSEVFQPDPEARVLVRQELGLAPDVPLIGLIARFHPMKGHEIFIEAARWLLRQRGDVHFLLAGRGVVPETPLFSACLTESGLAERLHLLGERRDIPKISAALDISSSSSSWGEGFSNTVCEAMSCAVPVVATDVGDSRRILGGAGLIVPPGDANALAEAWQRLLAMPADAQRHLGEQGRARVLAEFSLSAVADRYFSTITGEYDGQE